MTWATRRIWLGVAGLVSACYGSLQPLPESTPPLVLPGLIGRWALVVNPDEREIRGPVVVTADGNARYRISVPGNEDTLELAAHLSRVGSDTLADLSIAVDEHNKGWLVTVHRFQRLRLSGDTLWESSLDSDSLKAFLEREPGGVPHVSLNEQDLDVLLTAEPEAVERFLAGYLHRPGVFQKPAVYVRVPR